MSHSRAASSCHRGREAGPRLRRPGRPDGRAACARLQLLSQLGAPLGAAQKEAGRPLARALREPRAPAAERARASDRSRDGSIHQRRRTRGARRGAPKRIALLARRGARQHPHVQQRRLIHRARDARVASPRRRRVAAAGDHCAVRRPASGASWDRISRPNALHPRLRRRCIAASALPRDLRARELRGDWRSAAARLELRNLVAAIGEHALQLTLRAWTTSGAQGCVSRLRQHGTGAERQPHGRGAAIERIPASWRRVSGRQWRRGCAPDARPPTGLAARCDAAAPTGAADPGVSARLLP